MNRTTASTVIDDPRTTFDHAVALATALIGRVGAHQLANPTPCPEFDVGTLLGHMTTVLRRVAALGRGDDPFGPDVLAPVDGGLTETWLAAAGEVQAAWAEDDVLSRTIHLPWSQASGAATLLSYLNEVTVHTWDLATATGQRPAWDPQVLSLAFDGIRFLPEEKRGSFFADAVPIAEDAPLIDRLVAWNGRRP
ncbi:MAG: TIGR03086 family metal-binding protein [Actinomycetota bacterium]|nr:TIGR03086 family metal-binding protein [Actinomycetota bacterium]